MEGGGRWSIEREDVNWYDTLPGSLRKELLTTVEWAGKEDQGKKGD